MRQGFTFIEIIISVAILATLTLIIVGSFSRFNKSITLSRDAERIVSMLNEARTNTIASKNGVQYGVHFEASRAILFSGAVYDENAIDNNAFLLKTFESISNVSLGGGGDNVVFNRVTGTTINFGSVTISTNSDDMSPRVISISANGLANLE